MTSDPKRNQEAVAAEARPRQSAADRLFKLLTAVNAFAVAALIVWIGIKLFLDSSLTRGRFGFDFIVGLRWDSHHHVYGAMPFIYGTVVSSVAALVLSVPVAVMAAVYLAEYAPPKAAAILSFFIELIAAVPSIVFGFWGFIVLCPILQSDVNPLLMRWFGWSPLFAGPSVGTSMLAAGIVLAVMVMPFICSVSYSVLKAVPREQRSASYGLGATRWETIRNVVLPEAKSGIAGGIMLGLGRAIGETMAVVMVIGSDAHIHSSLLQAGYTMPALLANQFSEAFNVAEKRSALLEVALILFLITMFVNAAARGLMALSQKKIKENARGRRYRRQGAFHDGSQTGAYLASAVVGVVGFVLAYGLFPQPSAAHDLVRLLGFGLFLGGYLVAKSFTERPAIRERWRSFVNGVMSAFLGSCAGSGTVVLLLVVGYAAQQGIPALHLSLFTKLPGSPVDPDTGLKNAIVGTGLIMLIASAVGVPLGILGGIYVSEFSKGRVRGLIRFCSEVLSGIPSVVIGIFAYGVFVLPFKQFSAWSAGLALAVMMVPTVIRTAEEMMRLVPKGLREASLGLGVGRMQTILFVVIPAARQGILSGVMLAIARAAGETAPLLFTAFGSTAMVTSPSGAIGSLTLSIYTYALSGYEVWIRQAWAASILLIGFIFVLSLVTRYATRPRRLHS